MTDPNHHRDRHHILTVEERLRVCLTLTKGLYALLELAGEHHSVQLDGFEPDEVLHKAPELTRTLRDQLLAVRAALPFECMSREAPPLPPATPPVEGGVR